MKPSTDPPIVLAVRLAGPHRRTLASFIRLLSALRVVLRQVEAPVHVNCILCLEPLERAPPGEPRPGHARSCPIPKLRAMVEQAEEDLKLTIETS